ncbi:MAG: PVC-type heme-binding CxxCH protein [Planctomycetales bacterium]
MNMPRAGLWLAILAYGLPASSLLAQGYPPQAAVGKMTLPAGLQATLFASEPEVRQPIFCKCDDRGRLWTIQYLQYPNPAGLKRVQVDRYSRTVYDRKPEPPPHGPQGADRITILEDTDGDGRADRFRDFVTGLNLCTGVEFGFGGVFVIQAPYLLFYADRDRDDVPDGDPEVLLDGFGIEDAQSLANHLTWGPDGWLYGLNGSTTTCRIRGMEFQQGVWRYHPVTREFELFCEGGGNIFGLTFDRQGRLFYSANGGLFWHGVQGGYFEKNFGKHGPLHNLYAYGYLKNVQYTGQTGRPNTGATMYLGDAFPAPFHDAFLCGDFLTHTCSWWKVQPRGSTVQAAMGGLLLDSHDTWFGATDLCLSPEGAIYICDFHDQRTGHPDPDAKWDTSNGRIYRIQAIGAEPPARIDLASRTSAELVELLKQRNGWYTQRARRILSERRDAESGPALKQLAIQQEDADAALQGLWGASVSGALDQALAAKLLSHSSEHVRAWTVRLLGDARRVEPELGERFVELSRNDPSVIVRAQLAATAKRLPGPQGLPIVEALLSRDLDADDPYVPWLLWWGLEDKTMSDMAQVLERFARPERWDTGMFRANLERLMRRYAAAGTVESYAACGRLWQQTPEVHREKLLTPLWQGLTERAQGLAEIGVGGLFDSVAGAATGASPPRKTAAILPVSGALQRTIRAAWEARRDDPLRTRLALEGGLDAAYAHLLAGLKPTEPAARLKERLAILAEYARESSVPAVLALFSQEQPDDLQLSVLGVLQRFSRDDITQTLLRSYPRLSEPVKSRVRDVLFSRAPTSLALLQLVDEKQIPATEIPLEQLRPLASLANDEVNALVRKYWGNIQPGTPEEKLADMRRFSNDLRAGTGDAGRGKELFNKHCGTCHKLREEGTALGPDLTNTVKGDPVSLLASIVDPNAVVRREFLSYVVITKTGVVATGLLIEQDGASVTLVDAKNQRTRFPREQIDELTESPASLMPEKLLEQLSPQELRDLFAYLQSK